MFYFLLFYVFWAPLEYIQDKIPKGPTGVNYLNFMMLVGMIGWLHYRNSRQRPPLVRSPLNVPIIVWLAALYFGMLVGSFNLSVIESPLNPGSVTFKRYLSYFNGFLFFWLTAALVDSRKKIRMLLYALFLSSLLTFRSFYNQISYFGHSTFSNKLRIAGPFIYVGSNEMATFYLYSALIIGIAAFGFVQRDRLRWMLLGTWGMFSYAVLYSYSRATQLAYVLGIAVLALLRYRAMLVVLILGALTMDFWLPESVQMRWEMTTDEEGNLESSAASREVFWAIATDLFMSSPVVGHGIGSFIHLNPHGMDTHSLYYRILAEQGVVGAGAFILLFGAFFYMAFGLWRRGPDPFDRQLGLGLLVAGCSLLAANYFGDRFTHLGPMAHFWVLTGLAARCYAYMRGWEPLEDAPPVPAASDGSRVSGAIPSPSGAPSRDLKPAVAHSRGTRLWLVRPIERAPRSAPSPSAPSPPAPPSPARAGMPRLNIVGRRDKVLIQDRSRPTPGHGR